MIRDDLFVWLRGLCWNTIEIGDGKKHKLSKMMAPSSYLSWANGFRVIEGW